MAGGEDIIQIRIALATLTQKVSSIEEDLKSLQDDRKWLIRMLVGAVFSAILSLLALGKKVGVI